jgi:hypothetical protein
MIFMCVLLRVRMVLYFVETAMTGVGDLSTRDEGRRVVVGTGKRPPTVAFAGVFLLREETAAS